MSDHDSTGVAFIKVNPLVLQAHIEEAVFLFQQRDSAVSDPGCNLDDIVDLDSRLALHFRGLAAAGNSAGRHLSSVLISPDPGTVFTAWVVALQSGDGALLSRTVDAALTLQHQRAIVSATGWVPSKQFLGFADALLNSSSTAYQFIGLAGFATRRLDLGERLLALLRSPVSSIRVRACRAVGELGRNDLIPVLQSHFDCEDARERFWAIWSTCVLGDASALPQLRGFVTNPFYVEQAIQVYFRFCNTADAHSLLRTLAGDPKLERYAMIGSGIHGDPLFVGGLIPRMSSPALARVAGEAFCLITGMDSEAMTGMMSDTEVMESEQDEWDEELPWPGQSVVEGWWQDNRSRFKSGQRYLCGQTIDVGNCKRVLSVGLQRQRMAAAFELARLAPGRSLFAWKAPGLNQREAIDEY